MDISEGVHPSIAVNNNYVYIVWESNDDSIYIAVSNDHGNSFTNPIFVGSPGVSPLITSDSNGNIYVTWRSGWWESDIYFVRSEDHGNTFTSPLKVNGQLNDADQPSISAGSKGKVCIAWEQENIIYLSTSSNYGQSFKSPIQVNDVVHPTVGHDSDFETGICYSNGNAYVVWTDYRNENADIYFSAFSLDEKTGIEENGSHLSGLLLLTGVTIIAILIFLIIILGILIHRRKRGQKILRDSHNQTNVSTSTYVKSEHRRDEINEGVDWEIKPKTEIDEKEISICPYCGEEFHFVNIPKFCPYCRKQIFR